MKIDFDAEIKNLNGDVIFKSTDDKIPSTLADVAINALFTTTEKDRKLSGAKKFDLYVLGTIINAGGVIDLKAKEIVLLKDRIGEINGPLIVGRAYELLEPETTEPKEKEKQHGEGTE